MSKEDGLLSGDPTAIMQKKINFIKGIWSFIELVTTFYLFLFNWTMNCNSVNQYCK